MVVWIIGLSGAGKTTLARQVFADIKDTIDNAVFIDGDVIREVFGNDLGYSMSDRMKNAQRICNLCKFLHDQGIVVVCSILSIFHESQEWNRQNIANYYEVYIAAPIEQLIERDVKGIYQKAIAGEINSVVGMDIEFVPPKAPDLTIDNSGELGALLAHAEKIAAIAVGKK